MNSSQQSKKKRKKILFFKNNFNKSFYLLKKFKIVRFLIISTPILSSLFFFYIIGINRYRVESNIVIRNAEKANSIEINPFYALGFSNNSIADSKFLNNFLNSPQVFTNLQKEINIRKKYAKRNLDFYSGISQKASDNEVFKFLKRQIKVSLNNSSGEINLVAFAYDPETSLELNKFLIKQTELFINNLNQNIYREQIQFINNQVSEKAQIYKIASDKLKNFQETNRLLNINSKLLLGNNLIQNLEIELSKAKVELKTVLEKFIDAQSPEVNLKKLKVKELKRQIAYEKDNLFNKDNIGIAEKAQKLDELQSEVKFAADLYKLSLQEAEKNKINLMRKTKYVAILTNPIEPDKQYFIWRHKGFITSLIFIIVGLLIGRQFLKNSKRYIH